MLNSLNLGFFHHFGGGIENFIVSIIEVINLTAFSIFRMQKRSQSLGLVKQPPEELRAAGNTIAKFAKLRYCQNKQRSPKPCYFVKAKILGQSYEVAKKAQTAERDLAKAIMLYSKSASEGDKIDSCIKDFASVIHQMGYTQYAVQFLADLRHYYDGDLNKYDRLMLTLQRQFQPSGKHDCKWILFELPNKQKLTEQLIQSLFQNKARIKNIKVLNHLAVSEPSQQIGKWFIFQFDSFSAAKKTLEKFRFEEWFGINKYWLRGNFITCEATDGKEDFQKGYVVTIEMIQQNVQRFWSYKEILLWDEIKRMKSYNECAKMMIEEYLAQLAPTETDVQNEEFTNFK